MMRYHISVMTIERTDVASQVHLSVIWRHLVANYGYPNLDLASSCGSCGKSYSLPYLDAVPSCG